MSNNIANKLVVSANTQKEIDDFLLCYYWRGEG